MVGGIPKPTLAASLLSRYARLSSQHSRIAKYSVAKWLYTLMYVRGWEATSIPQVWQITDYQPRRPCHTSPQFPSDHRMPRAQPATHRPRLPVHIARLIATQKQRHPRNFIRHCSSSHWVQLPDFVLCATRSCGIVHGGCHACFDEARADGIAADGGRGELVGGRLHEGDDGGFGCGIIGCGGWR